MFSRYRIKLSSNGRNKGYYIVERGEFILYSFIWSSIGVCQTYEDAEKCINNHIESKERKDVVMGVYKKRDLVNRLKKNSEINRSCKNCKYWDGNSDHYLAMCKHPGIKNSTTGLFAKKFDRCFENRLRDYKSPSYACGFGGSWFEPIEESDNETGTTGTK